MMQSIKAAVVDEIACNYSSTNLVVKEKKEACFDLLNGG